MPRSKRAKIVHLSKTHKKGRELTLKLHASIQECIPQYPYIYVFRVDNMRNTYLKDLRSQLSDSRYAYVNPSLLYHPTKKLLENLKPNFPFYSLFFGKTKVMAVALGLTSASEPAPNTSLLTPHLHGSVGLIFSPRSPSSLLAHLSAFQPLDYARAGAVASRSFTIPAGTVNSRAGEVPMEEDVPLAHSLEPMLRKLGVPTRLVKGRVELDEDFLVCREGEVLGSGQTSLLKTFGVVTARFRVEVVAYYKREGEKVVVVQEDNGVGEEMEVDSGFNGFDS